MSVFEPATFPCPKCGANVEFAVVASINADRRPDLRDAILQRTFQVGACGPCGTHFRIAPEMTYFDAGRKQWILVQPAPKLVEWIVLEQEAQGAFDLAYGDRAVPAARAIGRGMQARIAFGWAALREKILCKELELDDVTLELVKIAIVRGSDECPLANDVELRLDRLEQDQLVMTWIKADQEAFIEELLVPRGLYDEIAADLDGWQELRQELSAGPFVDFYRLLIEANLPPEAG